MHRGRHLVAGAVAVAGKRDLVPQTRGAVDADIKLSLRRGIPLIRIGDFERVLAARGAVRNGPAEGHDAVFTLRPAGGHRFAARPQDRHLGLGLLVVRQRLMRGGIQQDGAHVDLVVGAVDGFVGRDIGEKPVGAAEFFGGGQADFGAGAVAGAGTGGMGAAPAAASASAVRESLPMCFFRAMIIPLK